MAQRPSEYVIDEDSPVRKGGLSAWQSFLLGWLGFVALAIFLVALLWKQFFVYVGTNKHLVIKSQHGQPLAAGRLLAEAGEKGIRREVKGEGWHLVWPILYSTEIKENTVIKAGQIGIVTTKFGKPLSPGQVLASEGEQGIQREVLQPGTYRLNLYAYDVKVVPATEIPVGYVGVMQRLLGKPSKGRFAESDEEQGILKKVLQPGLYYLNTEEYAVTKVEVGIFQTTFRRGVEGQKDTSIHFPAKNGLEIAMDCTIEWEVLPEEMPNLVAEYGNWRAVEEKVIDVQAHKISRDKGINYSAQDFLLGQSRKAFQDTFARELQRVCREKGVTVQSAFVREIVIPETYLEQIRSRQIASEKELTNRAREATASSEAEVEREERLVEQRVAEVAANTERLVASIDRNAVNINEQTKAQIEKLTADYNAQMAALDADRVRLLGQARAEAKRIAEVAKSSLYQMKMEVFSNDSEAFLKYSMAQQLNPKLVLRLFHAGNGTFWTNLGDKNLSLMLPANSGQAASAQ